MNSSPVAGPDCVATGSSTADPAGAAARLRTLIRRLPCLWPSADRVVVAYSGGRDSHTLLASTVACFASGPISVSAVHINHGLHTAAAQWARHCEGVCHRLGVDCTVLTVEVRPAGQGPEAAARAARYRAFTEHLPEGAVLLQAHHADDQVETVLLRLLRGCGAHGAAGMPATRQLGSGTLWRPWLAATSDDIAAVARAHGLAWVEDPSNADARFDRNFLRQRVLPQLRERWPSLAQSIGTAAANFDDAAQVLDAHADAVLVQAKQDETLPVTALEQGSPALARTLLHRWLNRSGVPVPSRATLDRVRTEVAAARADAQPSLRLGDRTVRRHRGHLHLVPDTVVFDTGATLDWPDPARPIVLPSGRLLHAGAVLGDGLDRVHLRRRWQVRFARGSALLKPPGRARARVKKLLNAAGVPAWERVSLPYLYIDGELAWVQQLGVDHAFRRADFVGAN
ncbi:MAG: tRNA lysidine(34) synthetase TilS [Pseudomonadota bacterium]